MSNPEKYLLPEEDGLANRSSQEYVKYKLKALTTYLHITNTAMRSKPWSARYYIDLQSGPGKNQIDDTIVLGSPLIALSAPYPATHFRFNELNPDLKEVLQQRIGVSPLHPNVKIYQSDANDIVYRICDEIEAQDKKAATAKQWPTLNLAFLDPEGLELKWSTIERLALVNRMDLIINFSTGGIVRAIGRKNLQAVDHFFGTETWREVDKENYDAIKRRRELIDFYRKRLEKFGYHIEIDPNLGGDDIAVNNSRNAQVYSLIFASKHELGDRFWNQAAKSAKPPRLPGF